MPNGDSAPSVVFRDRDTDAEKYRLHQAELLLIEAGYVRDPETGGWHPVEQED